METEYFKPKLNKLLVNGSVIIKWNKSIYLYNSLFIVYLCSSATIALAARRGGLLPVSAQSARLQQLHAFRGTYLSKLCRFLYGFRGKWVHKSDRIDWN